MRLAFDTKLRRPGCPLLQAAMGGDAQAVTLNFPVETWLLSLTPDLRLFETTPEQLANLVSMATRRAP